jgi:nicotinamidase/pyrazinamidase
MTLTERDALLVVDMQEDFITGSLPVPKAATIVPTITKLVKHFSALNRVVVFTMCWHPPDHCSFAAQGGPWTPHCVADTPGARLVIPLSDDNPLAKIGIVKKGTLKEKDAYSGFDDTDLDAALQVFPIKRLFVCGVATEYCVRATVIDALVNSYDTIVIPDAIKAVDKKMFDGFGALEEMYAAGAKHQLADAVIEPWR